MLRRHFRDFGDCFPLDCCLDLMRPDHLAEFRLPDSKDRPVDYQFRFLRCRDPACLGSDPVLLHWFRFRLPQAGACQVADLDCRKIHLHWIYFGPKHHQCCLIFQCHQMSQIRCSRLLVHDFQIRFGYPAVARMVHLSNHLHWIPSFHLVDSHSGIQHQKHLPSHLRLVAVYLDSHQSPADSVGQIHCPDGHSQDDRLVLKDHRHPDHLDPGVLMQW